MPSRFTVNLLELLEEWRELFAVGEEDTVAVTWNGASLEITKGRTDGQPGGMHYHGVYHPDVVCEPEPGAPPQSEPFVCCWCGSVCW